MKGIGSYHWSIINFMKINLLTSTYKLENMNPAYPNVWGSNNIWIKGKKIPMANREFQRVCFLNKKFLSLPFQHLLVSLCNCSYLSALDGDSSVHVYIWSNGITRYHGESDSEGPARIDWKPKLRKKIILKLTSESMHMLISIFGRTSICLNKIN